MAGEGSTVDENVSSATLRHRRAPFAVLQNFVKEEIAVENYGRKAAYAVYAEDRILVT